MIWTEQWSEKPQRQGRDNGRAHEIPARAPSDAGSATGETTARVEWSCFGLTGMPECAQFIDAPAHRPKCLHFPPHNCAPCSSSCIGMLSPEENNEGSDDRGRSVATHSTATCWAPCGERVRCSYNIRPPTGAPLAERHRWSAVSPPRIGSMHVPVPRVADQPSWREPCSRCGAWARQFDQGCLALRRRWQGGLADRSRAP
jgi:hypothetical protein